MCNDIPYTSYWCMYIQSFEETGSFLYHCHDRTCLQPVRKQSILKISPIFFWSFLGKPPLSSARVVGLQEGCGEFLALVP